MISPNECYIKEYCKSKRCLQDGSFCIKLFKINKLYDEALLTKPQRLHTSLRVDADNSDRAAFIKLKSYQDNIEETVKQGKNIYIYSSTCGNGKTAWSLRLLQKYIEAIWWKSDLTCKALFVNTPRFLLSLKDSITNESEYVNHIKNNVLQADLVVFDEIAFKAATQFESDHLLNIINARVDSGKANIYTSNSDLATLKQLMGDRLYSRIINMSDVIEFVGSDKRGIVQ